MTKVLFLGSRLQSYRCLGFLIDNFSNEAEIVAVSPHVHPVDVRPDQSVSDLAKKHGIKVIDRSDIRLQKFDLGISLLYDSVLDESELAIPQRGFVNFHLGPLPRLRGSNSVIHAILLARQENCWQFEVTLHYIVKKLDAGPVIDVMSVPVFEDDTAYSLHTRSSDKIYELFAKNIGLLINSDSRISSVPQTGEGKLYLKDDLDHYVDMSLPEDAIYDKIRAFSFPGKSRPYTLINNRKVYLTLDEK